MKGFLLWPILVQVTFKYPLDILHHHTSANIERNFRNAAALRN